MVPKKRLSKRKRLGHKYRIAGRIKDHQRKERRGEVKNFKGNRKSKKDPGIPNNWPFKEELLNEVEKQRQDAEDEKKKQRELAQKKRAAAKKALKKGNVEKKEVIEEDDDEEEEEEEEESEE